MRFEVRGLRVRTLGGGTTAALGAGGSGALGSSGVSRNDEKGLDGSLGTSILGIANPPKGFEICERELGLRVEGGGWRVQGG